MALNVRLADATYRPAILGSIDLHDPVRTQHFRGLTLVNDTGQQFHLARYHDFDYESRGPRALADFLGLPLSAVFPITYDLAGLVLGPATSLIGEIPAEPEVQLSRAELIKMAVL